MNNVNPIGTDWKDKKWLTRGGEVITLEDYGLEYLISPETNYGYLDFEKEPTGNLVFPSSSPNHPDDIISEYKG